MNRDTRDTVIQRFDPRERVSQWPLTSASFTNTSTSQVDWLTQDVSSDSLTPTQGATDDERDQILLAEAIAVDDRLVEMCKKELLSLQNAKLLPKRCRSTLLKYLASEQRLGGEDGHEAGTQRKS